MNLESYCRTFAAWGYATYCFDFCGGSPDEEERSDGKSTDMTVLTERDDLIAVMDYVKGISEHPMISIARLLLMQIITLLSMAKYLIIEYTCPSEKLASS